MSVSLIVIDEKPTWIGCGLEVTGLDPSAGPLNPRFVAKANAFFMAATLGHDQSFVGLITHADKP